MGSSSIGLSDRQLDEARRPQYSSIVARRSKSSTWTLKLALLVLLLAGAASFFITSQAPSFISVGSDSDLVMIPRDTLGREQVKFYSYRDRAGEELRFILAVILMAEFMQRWMPVSVVTPTTRATFGRTATWSANSAAIDISCKQWNPGLGRAFQ
jgi:hypothetical protein